MSSGLIDSRGRPMRPNRATSSYKKSSAPVMGEAFGNWAGRDLQYIELPGGGLMQFDLSRLTLSDYRIISTHYQVNSSLSLLSFMLHQLDWTIDCDNAKIASAAEENMRDIWTRLVRALSQAFWAGFSPNVLQWENDISGKRVVLAKVKDLVPEDCQVNWLKVEGSLPPGAPANTPKPKINVYDGIKQSGVPLPIPVQNTLWYPLLMQNGDYYGRKLLKYAFQPWYFSTLIHLFSNRYFERFGEPVPVGRAPSDEQVTFEGESMDANAFMLMQMQRLRSRGAVVLPSDKQMDSSGSPTNAFEYDISYLESQMRGVDFERYMTRLDEEISLALFTPLLLIRTADSGSYNLGVTHMQMYLWELNAIADDWAEYINRYILSPFADYNFGTSAPRPKIRFYQMGKTQAETVRAVLSALVSGGKVGVDLVELGQASGLSLTEIEELRTSSDLEPTESSAKDDREARVRDDKRRVSDEIILRVAPQIKNAFASGAFGAGWKPDIGFASKVSPDKMEILRTWSDDLCAAGFASPESFMREFGSGVRRILDGS